MTDWTLTGNTRGSSLLDVSTIRQDRRENQFVGFRSSINSVDHKQANRIITIIISGNISFRGADDRTAYVNLLKELRLAFEGEAKSSGQPKLILSAAVPASFEAIAAG